MDTRPAVAEKARFAGKLGHQIFVDVIRPVEIPDQHCADGVERDQKRDDDKRQAPDLDVVAEKNQDRDAHDQHKPSAGRADTLRILDRRRGRKAIKGGCLGGIGKAPRDQPVTLAGKLVDQADRFDLNHIGHRDAEGSDDQRHIHEQAEPSPNGRPVLPCAVHGMFQRDDQHHQRQNHGEEPFAGEFAKLEPVISGDVAQALVKARDAWDGIHQADDDKPDRKPVQERTCSGDIRLWCRGRWRLVRLLLRHRSMFPPNKGCPGRPMAAARQCLARLQITAWRNPGRYSRPLPRRGPHRGGISVASRRTCRLWLCRQPRQARPGAGRVSST